MLIRSIKTSLVAWKQLSLVIEGVLGPCRDEAACSRHLGGPCGRLANRLNRWHRDGSKNRYEGNDNKQLNESKGRVAPGGSQESRIIG